MFKNNNKLFYSLLLTITIFSSNIYAKEKYPYLQGKILYQFEFDRVLSTKKEAYHRITHLFTLSLISR